MSLFFPIKFNSYSLLWKLVNQQLSAVVCCLTIEISHKHWRYFPLIEYTLLQALADFCGQKVFANFYHFIRWLVEFFKLPLPLRRNYFDLMLFGSLCHCFGTSNKSRCLIFNSLFRLFLVAALDSSRLFGKRSNTFPFRVINADLPF